MEKQSRKRRIFSNFFVYKPIGFVIFLLFGIIAFFVVGSKVKIPVYTTVQTTAEREEGYVKFRIGEQEFMSNAPIFVYQSRDDYLEKIIEYQVDAGYIVTNVPNDFRDKDKINIDIQAAEISLLEHIFKSGGNTQ